MGAGPLKMTRSLLEEMECHFRHWDQHVPISLPGTFEAMVVSRKVKPAYCWGWRGQGGRLGPHGGGPVMQG